MTRDPRRIVHMAGLHVEVLALAVAARLLVKRRGLEPTLRRVARPGAGWGASVTGDEAMRATGRVHRLLGKGTCLEESVALAAVLARRGARPELVVGCRRYPDATWGAHAWVVSDRRFYDLIPSGQHAPLSRYSLSSGWTGEAV